MLILVRGLPGSGKSTIANAIRDFLHVEADDYFCGVCGGYRFDPKKLPNAHKSCQFIAGVALAAGKNVVVANTFTKQWEMDPYINAAKAEGHEVLIIEALGNFKNVHGVPDETIKRMKERWEP